MSDIVRMEMAEMIGDDWLLGHGLLEPLSFDSLSDVHQFTKWNNCALCFSTLVKRFNSETGKYNAYCPECESLIYKHNHISQKRVDEINEVNQTAAYQRKGEETERRTEQQILDELGF